MISWKWLFLIVLGMLLVAGTAIASGVDVAWPASGPDAENPAADSPAAVQGKPADNKADSAATSTAVGDTATLIASLTVFVLAIFVGFEVITKVPPTLHTPLMSGSNAISGITIVGALILAGAIGSPSIAKVMAFVAVIFATINVVGGFLVTDRMLRMFKRN